jgi:hypothetical protein
MADLSNFFDDFDDRTVAASTGVPEPVPPGEYMLQVDQCELVPTKDGTGMMLKCILVVVAGEFEGRKLFPQFNVRNKSAQAQTIGIGELKALALACGVDWEIARTDTDALLYKPFRANIGFEKEQINQVTGLPYPPRNRVLKYIPAGNAAPAAPAAKPVASAPAASARPAAPQGGLPWKKSA